MFTTFTPIISRSEAKASGSKTYFTGKPCPRGHVADRRVSSGTCCECKKQASKQWHSQNKDHSADYGKSYRAARGEDLLIAKREYQRDWTAQNKAEKRRRDAEYDLAKRSSSDPKFLAVCAAKTKRYEKKTKQATPSWANHDFINGMYELAQVFRSTGMNMHVDHAVPLQGKTVSGLHTHDNLQLMAGSFNQSKSNRYWPDMWQGNTP